MLGGFIDWFAFTTNKHQASVFCIAFVCCSFANPFLTQPKHQPLSGPLGISRAEGGLKGMAKVLPIKTGIEIVDEELHQDLNLAVRLALL